MFIKRLLILPLILLAAWMVMAFFVVRKHNVAHKQEQLTIGSIGEPDTLNPIISKSTAASEVEAFLFNALIGMDENLNIEGDLAKEYEVEQTSIAFLGSAADALEALEKLNSAKDQWPVMKLTSCTSEANTLKLHFKDPDTRIAAGTAYEQQLFKIIDPKELLPVTVITLSHNSTDKLPDGQLATADVVKAQLSALANSLEDVRFYETFPIADSLLSVTVLGDGTSFRAAIAKAFTSEKDSAVKVLDHLDQALLNEPVITFKIRRGVRWHDGAPLTSADVEFTYQSLIDPQYRSPRAGDFWLVKDVSAPDDYTFIVTYRIPYSECVSSWGIPVIPKHILSGKSPQWWADNYNSHPIGTGPFRFVEWKRNEQVRLEANSDYYEGPPNLPAIIFRAIPDSFVNSIAFDSKGFDTTQLMFHQIKRFKQEPKRFKLFQRWSQGYLYIGWNQKNPLFVDRQVRLALAHAVNIDRIIKYVYYGYARPSNGAFPAQMWYANKDIKPYPYDPENAKELLTQAGWVDSDGDGWLDKDGRRFEFDLITNHGNPMRALIQVLVQDDLKKIGIKVNTASYEWAVFINNYVNTRQFDAMILGWFTAYGYDQHSYWHSSQTEPPGFNFCSYVNPEVDNLLTTIRTTFDRDRIAKLCGRLQEIIYHDQPYLFLLQGYTAHALYKNMYVVRRPLEDGSWLIEPVRNTKAGLDGYDFYMPWWAPASLAPQMAQ